MSPLGQLRNEAPKAERPPRGGLSEIQFDVSSHTVRQPSARRPTKIAAIALANKIARTVWAMMARGEHYKKPVVLAA